MEASDTNRSLAFLHTEFILFGFPGISRSRHLLSIPFLVVYSVIVAGNILIIYRIWVEPSLHSAMYILMALLFSVNIIGTTAIVPKAVLSVLLGMDRTSLATCLFQMFFTYTMVMFESNVLLVMALDRYVAICRPLRYHDIMTSRLLMLLSMAGLVECSLLVSPIIIVASRVSFCTSNLILDFVCENMVLLNLACGDTTRIQIVGLMVRIVVTALDITLLLISYGCILSATVKVVMGKDRHKTLHTCGTHLSVVVVNYSCGLLSSVAYRIPISLDIQNLTSAIYYLFPATVHPLIYGYRMREIRTCLVKSWRLNSNL
ncbi:PREDICTED: putative olfactory receptor 52L2 [Nanorana parkeri]|uniref:putative olfactory receptor 52L2 n=1 Tax=Nanorana parkeri TaxID=125878 RepID=UPI000854F28C|nr:PREDICTED: putative olfactory receptor 52L2 [Nanorana parkeri]